MNISQETIEACAHSLFDEQYAILGLWSTQPRSIKNEYVERSKTIIAAFLKSKEMSELTDAVAQMFELKCIKDTVGKSGEYNERQPRAWKRLHAALTPFQSNDKKGA